MQGENSSDSGPSLFLPVECEPEWLDAGLADALLDYAIANEAAFRPGSVVYGGKDQINPALRNVLKLADLGPYFALLRRRALAAKPALEQKLGVASFPASAFEMEIAAHGDGARFVRHIDTFTGAGRWPRPRVLTLILYLNRRPKQYSGGALRMHALGGPGVRQIVPEHNLLVAFSAAAPHSVETVHSSGGVFADRRFAVNIWIHG
jgi:Rps23 Pro-64 3,4-dihydroxylase Tpa1-like proline 4-hydroxylase